jgi:thioesterase domain-containing protein
VTQVELPSIQVSTAAELEATIHQLIPLSVAMGVAVESFEQDILTLSAPLAPNINHQMSAFGGSLSALSALAGWGMLQLQIGKMSIVGNTVIGRSEAAFLRPVLKQLICRCSLPSDFAVFQKKLLARGKSSVSLTTEMIEDGEVAMTTSSQFVVRNRHHEPAAEA